MVDYLDERMQDGSRLFAILRDPISWKAMKDHLESREDIRILRFETDGITEGWLDFEYFGHHFTVHDPLGEFYVFVKDPNCSSFILGELMTHFRKLKSGA